VHGTNTTVDQSLIDRVKVENIGKLCVRRNGNDPKPRRYTTIEGFGLAHNLGVYNNGVDAIARALTERYFFCKDKHNPGFRNTITPKRHAFDKPFFQEFRSEVLSHMPALPRLSRQQVVDRYTGSKKIVYTEALESLRLRPLEERDARLNMFIKYEKQDLGKAPRGINPRDPRFNLELGRYIKHAEKPFFKAINETYGGHTDHTVIKGINADESGRVLRQKWDRFRHPVAVGLDAEKFDAHVTVDALKYEHSFYTGLFPGSSRLRWLLKQQLSNKGKAYANDGSVEFKIQGTRSSGDLNTSLGNCIIVCGCVYAFAKERGVEIELANNGDDCVVFMESSDLERFTRGLDGWFRNRGFSMVAEVPVYEFEQIEFCQTKPIATSTGWRMIRNHEAVLKKDPMCLIAVQNDKVFRKWMGAVGECGSILTSGMPVQSAFYEALMRNGTTCSSGMKQHIFKGSTMLQRIDGLATQNTEILPCSRVSYYYAFGVLPDHQIEIENYYRTAVVSDWDEHAVTRDALHLEPGLKLIEL